MLKYGKTTQTAISAISVLAECFDGGKTKLSSHQIAGKRNLPQPLVAKLLVTLSRSGLVQGTRGPGGGYWLAKDPGETFLVEIVELFEMDQERIYCPFGPGYCPNEKPCPVHDQLWAIDQQFEQFLSGTKLSVFLKRESE